MSYLSFHVVGAEATIRRLRGTGFRWGHTKPAMEEIAREMLRIEGALFDSQGRRGGGSWKRDEPQTIERKLFYDRDPRIMHDRLRLRNSLTHQDNHDNILDVTNDTIRFGSRVPYAAVHQEGKGGMPQRQIIKFTPRDERKFTEILMKHVMGRP